MSESRVTAPSAQQSNIATRAGMLIVFFALGFCSVIVQATLIRESLVVFSGNELCLGIVFGVWLFWIGVGAAIGSLISRRLSPFWPFLTLVILGAASIPFQIYALRIMRSLFLVTPGTLVPFGQIVLASLIFLAPFSFMIGITFPLGCKVYAGHEREDPLGIGWLYVIEAVGFLTGGLVFTFFLVEHYRAFRNATIVIAVLLAACLTLCLRALRGWARMAAAGVLALMLLDITVFAPPYLIKWEESSIQKRWLSIVGTTSRYKLARTTEVLEPRLKLHSHTDSKYQNLALGEEPGQFTVFGDGSLLFSFPDDYGFPQQANFILCEHPNPKRLLIIGCAIHGLLKEFLRTPLELVYHVDLDPKVSELVRPVLSPADAEAMKDPRVRFIYTDGRFFVKTTSERYDIIYVNLPAPSTAMLNRYYTQEFFMEAKRILNPGGVLALHIPSAANYLGEIVGAEGGSIFHTVRSVFDHMVISGGDTAYLFASTAKDVVTMDPDLLGKRFASRKISVPNFSAEQFPITIELPRVEFAWNAMMERKGVPLNTDLRPITYYYNLRRWDASAGSKLQPAFEVVNRFNIFLLGGIVLGLLVLRVVYCYIPSAIQKVSEVVLTIAIGLLLLAGIYVLLYAQGYRTWAALSAVVIALVAGWRLVVALRRQRTSTEHAQFNYLTVITVCGFSSMAFELILIFAFQNLYGFLYNQIGLIIALFMIGLAGGGLASNYLLRNARIGLKTLVGVEIAEVAYGLLLPLALTLFAAALAAQLPLALSQAFFMIFILVAGVLGGFVFPLVTNLYFRLVPSTATTAGKVDSADHVGACLGSLLAGTVLVPIIGITASSIFVGFLNLACVVLLVTQRGTNQ